MTTAEALDIAWILIAAALVMLMQAGFAALESGLVRTKNSINVAAKNFADFLLSTAVYWFIGFAIMFGASQAGLFGTSQFLFESDSAWLIAFFIFQVGFVGAAVTIVSGAVAERMRFSSYLIVALLMSALLYPVFGHWAWAGAAGLGAPGWLEDLGFIDFAGSTVVHSVGGWMALAAVLIIGPRIGRFGPGSVPIRGHNIPLVTLGVFILWFGWFGFNGGSTLGVTSDVPLVLLNTTISAAFGGLVALAATWLRDEHPDVPTIMNGALAGLVGITASANIVSPPQAVIIGSIAGLIMWTVTLLLERFRVDDAVGAVPVHLSAGVWGTVAVAVFGNLDAFGDGVGRIEQLGIQLVGIMAAFAWVFVLGYLILRGVDRVHPLRIDPDGEHQGLNIAEHGASTELVDLLTEMDTQRTSGDYTRPVTVEPNTEVGQIAGQYNLVLAAINEETAALELLQRVSAAVNEEADLEEAYRIVLGEVCVYGGWPLGHVYVVSTDGTTLTPTDIWRSEDGNRFAAFMERTAATTFAPGEGLPGAAAAARRPTYLDDQAIDERLTTPGVAADAEIRSGLALPVMAGQEAVAVLEFFSDEERPSADPQILTLMASVGTQLGRAVERRRADEARFRAVVDHMPALVFLRDLEGRFLLVNRRYEEFYKLPTESVQGRTLAEIEADLGVDLHAEALNVQDREVLAANRAIEYELDMHVEGREVYLASLKFPIPDATGQAIALGGIETDVTEHRMLEAKLAALVKKEEVARGELEVALEQLESSELIIERWKLDGTILAMNDFGCDLLGFPEAEVVGRNAFETIVPQGEAVQATWVKAGEILARDPSHYAESELQHQKKDGTPVWVAFRNKAIVDADGEVIEVLSVGLDVTERRALEAQLKAANLRMEGELNIGRDIQESMLPQHFPAFPDRDDFGVYATLDPAREVGGDLYDFYLLDQDHLCFLVGDVSDKGVPAALFMAVTKTLIKAGATSDADAASIMTHVNDEMAENNESSMFVTLFVAILDTRTGQMSYTNAGHNPPYVKRADGSVIKLDDRHGPVAGAIEGITFGSSELMLEAGDTAVLYSDGVTEAMDIDHNQYGDATLESLIRESAFETPRQIVALVNEAVAQHRGEAEQSDDITVLALEYKGLDPTAARLTLTIPATLESLGAVMETFGEFAQQHGLDDTVRRQVLLVLDDMLNNIATYAYEGLEPVEGEGPEIELRVELARARLVITISDAGVPFNPFGMNAPDVQASLEERDIGGLGIHLVRTVMDEVDYSRRAGRNVVTVTKRLEPADDPDTGGET